ncbi:hypothetical protein FF098_016570 [Parvularcula flava]|uniref:Sulfotransferase family protein n=1 Tax=Aquisalinus luteolus TaxID=1566827 RepID=A0A8J3ESM6_9PROT|nr:hypothetical protein [Aquisalinus luteolus]NHK29525.1 hypothetical protein [Aquisalinus luteolus]GGI01676.1 hypothetical protein GCM10011355_32890 [Aquisalinus luteolus]
MRLILHIGTEKTATTTIQHFLYANRKALADKGIALSSVLGSPNNRRLPAYCMPENAYDDFFRVRNIRTPEQKRALFATFEEDFAREVRKLQQGANTMVISSEHLHSRLERPESVEKVREILAPLFSQIEIVCYFREQSAVVKSLYSTSIKSGHVKTFADFTRQCTPEEHRYNYETSFSLWAEAFGKDALRPKIYGREHFVDGDICADFLAIIDPALKVADFDAAVGEQNTSLGQAGLEIGRINNMVNPRKLQGISNNNMRLRIMNAAFSTELAQRGSLDFDAATAIHDAFDASNRRFAAYFLGMTENPFPKPGRSVREGDEIRTLEFSEFLQFWESFLVEFSKYAIFADKDADTLIKVADAIERKRELSAEDAARLADMARQIRTRKSKADK